MSDSESFEICAREARAADRDRYFCALFAPRSVTGHLLALLAFDHELARIAELVSEPMLGEIRLEWWREALAEARAGRPRRHPVVLALADTVRAHGIDLAELQACVEARAFDLDAAAPETMAALVDHVRATAGRVGRLWARCLVPDAAAAAEAAERAWTAYGLIGLARAVPHHAARGRIYLPSDAGLTAQAVATHRTPEAVAAAVAKIGAAAEAEMAGARVAAGGFPKAARPALLPAALAGLYARRLAAAGFDPYRFRSPSLLRRQIAVSIAALWRRGRP